MHPNLPRPQTGTIQLWLFLLLLTAILTSHTAVTHAQPQFLVPTDADALVLSYSEIPDMLANPDTTPRVRVYASGRVLIHYPSYSPKAGDYETYLNHGQLQKLLLTVAGVVDFDPSAAAQRKNADKQARREATGEIFERSDEVLEKFEIQLENFHRTPAEHPRNVHQTVKWRDIKNDAQEHPEAPGISDLNNARDAVRALMELPDVKQVQGADS